MSTRNRYTTEERVAVAQHRTNKLNGVQAVQESKSGRPSVDDWVANGGVIERLPAFGNMFTDNSRVTYGS